MLGNPYAQMHDDAFYGNPQTMPPPPTTWPRPTADSLEPTRREKPLELLLEHSSAPAGVWRPLLVDEDWRCFSFLWPRALSRDQSQHFLERLMTTAPWVELKNTKKTSVTRCTCWYARGGCNCYYTYGRDTRMENSRVSDEYPSRAVQAEEKEKVKAKTSERQRDDHAIAIAGDSDGSDGEGPQSPDEAVAESGVSAEFLDVMQELTAHVFGKLFPGLGEDAWPNSANVNLYRDGRQAVGWHADDESLFKGKERDCPIVSVSLGATREFWVALKRGGDSMDPDLKTITEVDLQAGDILTMEGRMQRHCVHLVPKVNPREPLRSERINITFRWVREHRYRCPLRQQRRGRSSTVPRALRGLFGEVQFRRQGKNFGKQDEEEEGAHPAMLFGATYATNWCNELRLNGMPVDAERMEWMACHSCKHVCFEDGRACAQGSGEYEGHWFCRKCWLKWTPVGEDPDEHGRPSLGPLAPEAQAAHAVATSWCSPAISQLAAGTQMPTAIHPDFSGDPFHVNEIAAANAAAAAWWTAAAAAAVAEPPAMLGCMGYPQESLLTADALPHAPAAPIAPALMPNWWDAAAACNPLATTPTAALPTPTPLSVPYFPMPTAAMPVPEQYLASAQPTFAAPLLASTPASASKDPASELKALLGVGAAPPRQTDTHAKASADIKAALGMSTKPAAQNASQASAQPQPTMGGATTLLAPWLQQLGQPAQSTTPASQSMAATVPVPPPPPPPPPAPITSEAARAAQPNLVQPIPFSSAKQLEGASASEGEAANTTTTNTPAADDGPLIQTADEDSDDHPLHCGWCIWVLEDREGVAWSEALRRAHGPIHSSDELWRRIQQVGRPSSALDTDFSVFQAGVKPAREDPRVSQGGRWILALTVGTTSRRGMLPIEDFPQTLDKAWSTLLRVAINGDAGNSVCGAVVSVRSAGSSKELGSAKLAMWITEAEDRHVVREIGQRLQEALKAAPVAVPSKGWQLAFEDFQRGVTLRI